MNGSSSLRALALPVAAMGIIVVASNVLVQYPFTPFGLADVFTWGAFTYPVAFLVTDLTNRRFGPALARRVVAAGFAIAVVMSMLLSTPRIAVASGAAFLLAQLLDVAMFDRLRRGVWWRAPFVSSLIASVLDTLVFFSLAFSASLAFLFGPFGANVPFALEEAPLVGLAIEAPRWVSWALGDFVVKTLIALLLLVPYGALRRLIPALSADRGAAAA